MRTVTFHRAAILLAALSVLHGLVYLPLVRLHTATDTDSYVASAHALLHGSYSTPLRAGFYYVYPQGFYDITGVKIDDRSLFPVKERQAFRPPGYPVFLALAGGGSRGVSRGIALFGQALLFGVGTWLLALTVRRWWGDGVGLLAAGLYALDPYSKHYVTLILSDCLAGTLVLATAYLVTRAWQSPRTGWWAAAGLAAGALTLVRAVFVLAVPLVVLAAVLRPGRLRAAGAALAAALVLLLPWLGWTWSASGAPVLATYGEGFNLLAAAHGEGYGHPFGDVIREPGFLRDFDAPHRLAPTAAELRSDSTAHPRYVREADRILRSRAEDEFRRRLADEPGQVAWESLYRMYFLWAAHEDWYQPAGAALRLLQALDWIVIALGLGGIWLALRRGGPARAVAIALLAYTVVLGTHHVEARFAMPLRGLLLAYVALALAELARLVPRESRQQERAQPERPRGGAPG
jgi:4-amino-4-deoxy-L-arabinose transferase-like glycosyltransferase